MQEQAVHHQDPLSEYLASHEDERKFPELHMIASSLLETGSPTSVFSSQFPNYLQYHR